MGNVPVLEVMPEAERTIIRRPWKPAELSLRRGSIGLRLASAFAVLFGLLCLSLPLLVTHGKLPRFRHWTGDSIDILTAVVMFAGLGFFALIGCLGAIMAFIGFLPTQTEFEVNRSSLTIRNRYGRWTRSRTHRDIGSLLLVPPAAINQKWQGTPLPERKVRLAVELPDGKCSVLCRYLLHRDAEELANHLADAMQQHAGHRPPIADHVNPACRQIPRQTALRGFEYRLDRTATTVTLTPVLPGSTSHRLLKDPNFRSFLWVAILPNACLVAVSLLWPDIIPADRLPTAFSIFTFLGALGMAAAWWAQSVRQAYHIDRDSLTSSTHFNWLPFRRTWRRGDILGLRIGQRIGDKGRPADVLELITSTGRIDKLESGNLPRLQYLLMLLRRELGLPDADPQIHQPTDISQPPDNCPFSVTREHDMLTINRPARWTLSITVVMSLGLAMLLGAFLAATLTKDFISSEDQRAMLVACWSIGLFGLLCIVGAVHDATFRYRISFAPTTGLALSLQTIFYTRRKYWPAETVADITEKLQFPNNPNSNIRLSVMDTAGKEHRLITGKPLPMRYLAASLRANRPR